MPTKRQIRDAKLRAEVKDQLRKTVDSALATVAQEVETMPIPTDDGSEGARRTALHYMIDVLEAALEGEEWMHAPAR